MFALSAAVLAGVISIGAARHKSDARPPNIEEDQWHALGRDSGIAVTRELPDSIVGAELYIKTDDGWRRVRIENPAVTDMLKHK